MLRATPQDSNPGPSDPEAKYLPLDDDASHRTEHVPWRYRYMHLIKSKISKLKRFKIKKSISHTSISSNLRYQYRYTLSLAFNFFILVVYLNLQ